VTKETETVVVDQEEAAPEASQDELTAREGGWLPREEWVEAGNDASKWKTPELFNEFGSLEKRIGQMDRAIGRYKEDRKKTDEAIKKLAEHTVKQVQMQRELVLKDLKLKRREALRENDHETAEAIEDEMDKVKDQAREDAVAATDEVTTTKTETKQVSVEVDEWLADSGNAWYKTQPELKQEADSYFDYLMSKGIPIADALKKVTANVKKEHPQHFKTQKQKAKTTEGGDEHRSGDSKVSKQSKVHINSVDQSVKNMAKEMSRQNPKAYPTAQSYVDALASEGFFN
jgi:hypothetical protein